MVIERERRVIKWSELKSGEHDARRMIEISSAPSHLFRWYQTPVDNATMRYRF